MKPHEQELEFVVLEELGTEAEILLGAFMPSRFDDRGPVVLFSRNGHDFTAINDGEPVFIVPNYQHGVRGARDFDLLHHRASSRFYSAFTAGHTFIGRDGYFSIWGSMSLRAGTWFPVANVDFSAVTGPSGQGTLYGPCLSLWVEDIYGFAAACGTHNYATDLRLHWVRFLDPMDLSKGHTAPVAVQVPTAWASDALNEVEVFEKPDGSGWLMEVFNFTRNCYQVYESASPVGQWETLQANIGHQPREGIFSLPLSDGGWRTYTEEPNTSTYAYADLPSNFSITTPPFPGFTIIAITPARPALGNGKMIRVSTPMSALFQEGVRM